MQTTMRSPHFCNNLAPVFTFICLFQVNVGKNLAPSLEESPKSEEVLEEEHVASKKRSRQEEEAAYKQEVEATGGVYVKLGSRRQVWEAAGQRGRSASSRCPGSGSESKPYEAPRISSEKEVVRSCRVACHGHHA